MKPNIHPKYHAIKVTCGCGSVFETHSTMDKDQLTLEVCKECHPFYTGKQKLMDATGRVERFRQRYSVKGKAKDTTASSAKDTNK